MSRLLLENSNKTQKTLEQLLESEARSYRVDWNREMSQVTWSTPRKSTELKAQVQGFQKL
jgi:hypothetical protein